MTRNIDEEDAAVRNVDSRSSNGVLQNREVKVINESGPYTAILTAADLKRKGLNGGNLSR